MYNKLISEIKWNNKQSINQGRKRGEKSNRLNKYDTHVMNEKCGTEQLQVSYHLEHSMNLGAASLAWKISNVHEAFDIETLNKISLTSIALIKKNLCFLI